MKDGICPKCGSQDIIPGVPPMDRGHYNRIHNLGVELFERPRALLFQGRRSTGDLRAWICGWCGYTELYTDNHQELYAIYRRSKEQPGSH